MRFTVSKTDEMFPLGHIVRFDWHCTETRIHSAAKFQMFLKLFLCCARRLPSPITLPRFGCGLAVWSLSPELLSRLLTALLLLSQQSRAPLPFRRALRLEQGSRTASCILFGSRFLRTLRRKLFLPAVV